MLYVLLTFKICCVVFFVASFFFWVLRIYCIASLTNQETSIDKGKQKVLNEFYRQPCFQEKLHGGQGFGTDCELNIQFAPKIAKFLLFCCPFLHHFWPNIPMTIRIMFRKRLQSPIPFAQFFLTF